MDKYKLKYNNYCCKLCFSQQVFPKVVQLPIFFHSHEPMEGVQYMLKCSRAVCGCDNHSEECGEGCQPPQHNALNLPQHFTKIQSICEMCPFTV